MRPTVAHHTYASKHEVFRGPSLGMLRHDRAAGEDVYHNPNDLRHDDSVREAVRFGAVVAALGVAFLLIAAGLVSTCSDSTVDTVACGAPERTLLALGAPAIFLVGGVWAFVRTYRAWRNDDTWWAWQGAGWFLLTSMLFVLVTSLAPLAGPAMSG